MITVGPMIVRTRGHPSARRVFDRLRPSFSARAEAAQATNVARRSDAARFGFDAADPSQQQPDDRILGAGEHDVGLRRTSRRKMHLPSGRNQRHRWIVLESKFDRDVLAEWIDALESSHDHVTHPVRPKVILAPRPDHERSGPPTQGIDGFVKILPPRGQRVPTLILPDHAVCLEAAQAVDEEVGGDPRQTFEELAVPAGPVE